MLRKKTRAVLRSLPQQSSHATIDGAWSPVFVEEIVLRHIKIGRKSDEASERGRASRQKPDRDRRMWQEFQAERPGSRLSDSALQKKIGARYGLKRSAAIEAIKRGKNLTAR